MSRGEVCLNLAFEFEYRCRAICMNMDDRFFCRNVVHGSICLSLADSPIYMQQHVEVASRRYPTMQRRERNARCCAGDTHCHGARCRHLRQGELKAHARLVVAGRRPPPANNAYTKTSQGGGGVRSPPTWREP